ncbi:MAG: oligosaccharide flippase family protein [Lachnospiraceae bacterium]
MMQTPDYKKVSTFYLVGNLFNKGITFLTVPIFTRILSTADYGIVTTYNSWIAILSLVIGFAIHMGIRAAFIDYKSEINEFMSVSTAFTLACGILISLFLGSGALLLQINIDITIIVLCIIQGLATALVQNYSMYLMMQYKYKFRTVLMILPNLISVMFSVLSILFIVKTDLFMGRIVPTALINVAFGLLTVVLVYRRSRVFYNKTYLKYALTISAPLVLHGIALNILSQSDRTMITWLTDASQTGIYSLIYNFSMVATVITTSMEGVWVPWFTENLISTKIESINTLAKDFINLMTYAMVGVMLLGPEVVKILATEKYWEGIVIIPPVILANYIIFAYTLYVNIEHFHKKTLYITGNTLIAAGINLILNYLLIPRYGYVAAAYTTLVSYLVAFILHSRYANKLDPGLYPLKTFFGPFIHIFIAVIIFYQFMDQWYIRWLVVIVYIIAMIYIHRKRIVEFFPEIKKHRKM